MVPAVGTACVVNGSIPPQALDPAGGRRALWVDSRDTAMTHL